MNTQARIVFVRDAIGEGTAAVLARECINHLDAITKDLKVKDERIEELRNEIIELELNPIYVSEGRKELEDKIAELNKRIKGLEKLLTASVERSLVFEEKVVDVSKENMLLLSRLVDKDEKIEKWKHSLKDKIEECLRKNGYLLGYFNSKSKLAEEINKIIDNMEVGDG